MTGRSSLNDREIDELISRKVRTPQGRVLHNVESWQREGKCNRKYNRHRAMARFRRDIVFGKGEKGAVRAHQFPGDRELGKPHPVQDQIGKRLRVARSMFPGRSQEMPGNRHP